jgi:Zn/Cd-binding protein ZinT
MVGALEWSQNLYVKEVWHSVYSILSNLYLDSDISMAAENSPEKHTKPYLDQKEKDYSEWKEAYAIFLMGFSLTFIAVVLIIHFTHK